MPFLRGTRYALPAAWAGRLTAAQALLTGETQGLALDFTDLSAFVRDATTPVNNFNGNVNTLLTYSSPSTKYIRNSSGVYVPGTTLRTEYDAAGAALGVRIEEARTNLLLNNRTLNNASGGWTETNATITLNATTAIDGATSADKIEATAGGACSIARTFTGTAAAYTLTFRVKNDDCGWCVLSLNDGTTTYSKNFDIATGALGANGANAPTTSTIEDDGNGWYVCRITATMAVASCTATLSVTDADSASDPDAGEGLFADFAQVELGAFHTSPIVTAGSTVTRAADNISLAAGNFPAVAGVATIMGEVRNQTFSGARYIVSMGNATGNPNILTNGANGQAQVVGTTINASGAHGSPSSLRIAGAFESGNTAVAVNGTVVGTDPDAATINTNGSITIGSISNTSHLNAHLAKVFYVPRRMTDTQLQALTA